MTIGEGVLKSASWLAGRGVDSPRLDAELLLAGVLDCDRLRLYMDWQKPLLDLEVAAYRESVRRRGQEREPVARIVGHRNFYGRDFEVSPDTFVPRPETEGLVERALQLLERPPAQTTHRATVFEVGTGTGCIIVTLAAEAGGHRFLASDVAPGALATAKRNAHRLGVEGRVEFRLGADFADWRGTLEMIVSNPPYIRSGEIPELDPEVRVHDPMAALDGGEDGLDVVRRIATDGAALLAHGGWTLLEIGNEQALAATALFDGCGLYEEVRIERDLEGNERYLIVRRNGLATE